MTLSPAATIEAFWTRVWGEGDPSAISELFAPEFIRHTKDGSSPTTAVDFEEHLTKVGDSLRCVDITIDQLIADGDAVSARVHMNAVLLTTGERLRVTWMANYRFEQGRIAEVWSMHQSGLDW